MLKTTKNNFITYGMVILAYIIVQIFLLSGSLSNLMQGLLVPLCTYVILALSLNLTVGVLGELSLGHAGFKMCIRDSWMSGRGFFWMQSVWHR